MKKLFFLSMVATTMLSMSSCVSEDLDLNKQAAAEGKGFIALNVTNDDALATRTVGAAPTDWTVKLGGQAAHTLTVGTIASQSLAAGDYTVEVYNYATEALALATNSNYGDAWYYGDLGVSDATKKVTVSAGATSNETLALGRAKNAKLTVESKAPASAVVTVTVTSKANTSRALTFTKAAGENTLDHTEAFFPASDELTIAATYNGVELGTGTVKAQNLTLGVAATNNKIIIDTNGNGKIRFTTITYDDEFTTGNTQTITFDAATGEALSVE